MRAIQILSIPFFCAALILSGCGGGGGSSGNDAYSSTSTVLRTPKNGDSFEYKVRVQGSYYDGSSPINDTGSLQYVYTLLGHGTDTNYDFFRVTSSLDLSGGPLTTTSKIGVGPEGGLYFDTDEDGCFVTGADAQAQGLPMTVPGTFGISVSQNSSSVLNCSGRASPYSYTFTVVGRETVSTPLGDFDAFKISYREQLSNNSAFSNSDETGFMWFYPPLGLVKQTALVAEGPVTYTTNISIDIVSTSVAFD